MPHGAVAHVFLCIALLLSIQPSAQVDAAGQQQEDGAKAEAGGRHPRQQRLLCCAPPPPGAQLLSHKEAGAAGGLKKWVGRKIKSRRDILGGRRLKSRGRAASTCEGRQG